VVVKKHVSWHGATGYEPSPSRTRKREIPPREKNLQEFGG